MCLDENSASKEAKLRVSLKPRVQTTDSASSATILMRNLHTIPDKQLRQMAASFEHPDNNALPNCQWRVMRDGDDAI